MPRETTTKDIPKAYTNTEIINAATGRFSEVANELKFAEPYPIDRPDGTTIIIPPITRRRRKSLKAAQAAYLLSASQLSDVMQENNAAPETISRIENLVDESEQAYDKALFGEAYDEVVAYFDELQEELWDAMYTDVHRALVNRVALPEDVCSKCGQKVGGDDDEEGKDESSSTSSNATSTT